MSGKIIALPEKMDLANVFRFAKELDHYEKEKTVTIDFGEERYFPPFALLFISLKLKSYIERAKAQDIAYKNVEKQPYPAHMGFFRVFGLEYGRQIGEVHPDAKYQSITRITRGDLEEKSTDKYQEVADLIQRHADKMANTLVQDTDKSGNMFDVISYGLREIMRNVFEHSRTKEVYYCSQFWKDKNRVEVSIADLGVGIRRGLSENPNFRFTSDKEAIEMSLLPSVSGKTHLPRASSNWFNSGYGLYMTSRLARHGQNFVIASGLSGIRLSETNKTNFTTSFPGTALRLNFDANLIGDVKARLEEFRKEGDAIAKTIKGSGNRPPSGMSLLLRRDFK